jgi:predicted transcriptional regulator
MIECGGAMKKGLDSIILTRQELQIMKVVWDRGEATVRDVCKVISRSKPTAYTTVLTLMGILEEKGVLVHVRSGRAFVYKPLLSRQQATRNQVHDVVTRFFDGRPDKLIEDVLTNEVTSERLSEVRNLIESKSPNQVV